MSPTGNGLTGAVTTSLEHDTTAHQYRLVRDGETLSMADYRPLDDGVTLVFHHTLTTPRHRGNGYAAALVGQALDDARAGGHKVVASCWFVDEYMQLHREYDDLRVR